MSYWIKQDDLEPDYVAICKNSAGTAINLSTATSARFIMRKRGSTTTKVAAAATITDAASGEVTYSWASGDTDTAGTFDVEIEITWPTSRPQKFPGQGYETVTVSSSLEG